MAKKLGLIFTLFVSITVWAKAEYLVVFTSDTSNSFGDKDFIENYYPELVSKAEANGFEVILKDAQDGVFENTLNTPSFYLVTNTKSVQYKGRYTGCLLYTSDAADD